MAILKLNIGKIMATKSLKKHIILALLIFLIYHFGYIYIYSREKRAALRKRVERACLL
jgi:hypothetical protein